MAETVKKEELNEPNETNDRSKKDMIWDFFQHAYGSVRLVSKNQNRPMPNCHEHLRSLRLRTLANGFVKSIMTTTSLRR